MSRRRMVLYLLLNALVSVLVSGTVLFFYDRATHKTYCSTNEMIPTIPAGSVNADIVSVSGAGALASESVSLQNNGDSAIFLSGWTLKDGQGSTYTFPQLTFTPMAWCRSIPEREPTPLSDLFWGLFAPVWKSGELVALYDTQNIARAFYRIP